MKTDLENSDNVTPILKITKNVIDSSINFNEYYLQHNTNLYSKQLPLLSSSLNINRKNLLARSLALTKMNQNERYFNTEGNEISKIDIENPNYKSLRVVETRSKKLPPLCPFYNNHGELLRNVISSSKIFPTGFKTNLNKSNANLYDSLALFPLSIDKNKNKKNKDNLFDDFECENCKEKVDYNLLKYDEKEIFEKNYFDFIKEKIKDIKEKKNEDKINKLSKKFLFGKEKIKTLLNLESLSLVFEEIKENNNNDDENEKNTFQIPIKKEINLPFEILPVFYLKDEEEFKKILINLIKFDENFENIIFDDSNLSKILNNNFEYDFDNKFQRKMDNSKKEKKHINIQEKEDEEINYLNLQKEENNEINENHEINEDSFFEDPNDDKPDENKFELPNDTNNENEEEENEEIKFKEQNEILDENDEEPSLNKEELKNDEFEDENENYEEKEIIIDNNISQMMGNELNNYIIENNNENNNIDNLETNENLNEIKKEGSTTKTQRISLKKLNSLSYNLKNIFFDIFPDENKNIIFNTFNIFSFLWNTPSKKFKVNLILPKIIMNMPEKNIMIQKFIEKKLFFYIYKKNFENWDFYCLKYLSSFKRFRYLLDSLSSHISLQNQLLYLTLPKIKSYNLNNIQIKNFHTDENNINFIDTFSPFVGIISLTNIEKCLCNVYTIHFNFYQMKKFKKIEKFIDKINFMLKFINFNFKLNNITFDYETLDEFKVNEWINDVRKFSGKDYFKNDSNIERTQVEYLINKNLKIKIEIKLPVLKVEKNLKGLSYKKNYYVQNELEKKICNSDDVIKFPEKLLETIKDENEVRNFDNNLYNMSIKKKTVKKLESQVNLNKKASEKIQKIPEGIPIFNPKKTNIFAAIKRNNLLRKLKEDGVDINHLDNNDIQEDENGEITIKDIPKPIINRMKKIIIDVNKKFE